MRIRRRNIAPEQLVWVFGFARSGTTWLGRMLSDLGSNELWNEPLVGALFGDFYDAQHGASRRADFIMARTTVMPGCRAFAISSLRGHGRVSPTLPPTRT